MTELASGRPHDEEGQSCYQPLERNHRDRDMKVGVNVHNLTTKTALLIRSTVQDQHKDQPLPAVTGFCRVL